GNIPTTELSSVPANVARGVKAGAPMSIAAPSSIATSRNLQMDCFTISPSSTASEDLPAGGHNASFCAAAEPASGSGVISKKPKASWREKMATYPAPQTVLGRLG